MPFRSPLAALLAAALLAGCASTAAPVAYEASASPAKAARFDSDLSHCRTRAEQAVGINGVKGATLTQASTRRGATEFVKEAVDSLVVGSRNAWSRARGAAAGEAAGTLAGVLLNWNEPDRVHREFVDRCLKERGHTVLGWR